MLYIFFWVLSIIAYFCPFVNLSEQNFSSARQISLWAQRKGADLSREHIPSYLEKVISHGTVVSNKIVKKGSREGYERIYYYKGNHYVITGIGTNGFVISAYPKKKKG